MSANTKQVGGDHYKTDYQHWDMLVGVGFSSEYYAGQVTKYLTRWRKKHGIRDLNKSYHFLQKMVELTKQHGKSWLKFGSIDEQVVEQMIVEHYEKHLDHYFTVNEVGQSEKVICMTCMFATTLVDLEEAELELRSLMVKVMEEGDIAGAHKGDEPVSVKFNFIEYQDDGNYMKWKCKSCKTELVLSSDEPPSLNHKCPT